MKVNPYEVVSPDCAKRAERTDWGALARVLGEILYNADTYKARVNGDGTWVLGADDGTATKFAVGASQYVPDHLRETVRRLGLESDSHGCADVTKVLRVLMVKCEIEAVREATR